MNQKQFEEIVIETKEGIRKNLKDLHGQLSSYYLVRTPTYDPRNEKEYSRGYIDSSYEKLEKISLRFGFKYKRPCIDIKKLLDKLGEKADKHADYYTEIPEKLSRDALEKKLDELDKRAEEDINKFFEENFV